MPRTLSLHRRLTLMAMATLALAVTLLTSPAQAHRYSPFGGSFPHVRGSWLYLPYTHMTAGGYVNETNAAMRAWYDTPTRVWPYQTSDYNSSKVDVYTQWWSGTEWGMAINKPCSYAGCSYQWVEIYLNSRTMNPESFFTRQGITVHEVGHALGLSHVCGEAQCPSGYYRTIMQWGRLSYNIPQTHDINDVNAIYP
jgi:hypothetical protein